MKLLQNSAQLFFNRGIMSVSGEINSALKVQELSIQWLHMKRTGKFLHLKKEEIERRPELADLVRRVVRVYNEVERNKKQGDKPFELLEERQFPLNYRMMAYRQVQNFVTNIEKTVGREEESVMRVYILFFFRTRPADEIVALTTGHAHRIVEKCASYSFPLQVGMRVLDPERIDEIKRRSLIVPGQQETLIKPSGRELCKSASLYYLVLSFKARVKQNSSLMSLSVFDSLPLVEIGARKVRFHERLKLDSYPSLLDHCSKYVRGEDTYALTAGMRETVDPQFEFLQFLQPADESGSVLDAKLVEQVVDDHAKGRVLRASLFYKLLDEFLGGNTFEIQSDRGSRFLLLSNEPPSLERVIASMLRDGGTLTAGMFTARKLRFKDRTGKNHEDLIANFLEGEIRSIEGVSYFKLRGMWYMLAADYLTLVHEDFKNLLRQTLIQPTHEAQLTRPWRGNKKRGSLIEQDVKAVLSLPDGIRSFMKKLKDTNVCYVSEDSTIQQRALVGEILDEACVANNKQKIEEKLLSGAKLPDDEVLEGLFGPTGSKIKKALQKKRSVVAANGRQHFVVNPFPYPLRAEPALNDCYDAFVAFLAEKCEMARVTEDEAAYSRTYLYSATAERAPFGVNEGALVFDQICPDKIEPCDVLRYTKDTVYLYHIKETFGNPTRDACSQVLNAAKEFRSALSTRQAETYLLRLWRLATNPEESLQVWRKDMRTQLEALGQENFFRLFYDRKMVFVYAFLNQGQNFQEEAKRSSCLSSECFREIVPGKEVAVFEALKKEQYLDDRGRLTGKFMGSSQTRFTLAGFESEQKAIYDRVSQYASESGSTIAKLELIRLAQEMRSLGFEFRICQIPRQDDGASQGVSQSQESSLEVSIPDLDADVPAKTPPPAPPFRENAMLGFKNYGNTCYLNASLQALFNIPELRRLVIAMRGVSPLLESLATIMEAPNGDLRAPQLKDFRDLLFSSREDLRSTLVYPVEGARTPFLEKIQAAAIDPLDAQRLIESQEATRKLHQLDRSSQHDAQEFMQVILGALDWHPLQMCAFIDTREGAKETNSDDRTNSLQMSLAEDSEALTFQQVVDHYFTPVLVLNDPLTTDMNGRTYRFDEYRRTERMKTSPDNLIIQLKRFDDAGNKITTPVTFPENGIVRFPAIRRGQPKLTYEIVGFVNHHGLTIRGGHYTADVKNYRDPVGMQRWVRCDDESVSLCPPDTVNPEQEAYIVVLRRKV